MTPPPVPVLLALGSNIEPEANLRRAVERLGRRIALIAVSPVYETEAVGSEGPPFLNAALLAETALPPERLKFNVLRPLERSLGRVRVADPNAPRPIDVDICLFGDLVVDDPGRGVVIPDPGIYRYAHVARPLADLSSSWRHPVSGETLGAIARRFEPYPGLRLRPDLELSLPG